MLRSNDIAQVEELAKEWALEGIKIAIGEDGKGVWWIVANLVSVEFIAIEDVISKVVQMVSNPSSGKVLPEYTLLIGRDCQKRSLWSCYVRYTLWSALNQGLNFHYR